MPSLICLWEGRCNDRRQQAELITAMQELAQHNRARWEGVEIPRPDFLSIPREEQERQASETALVRLFDGPIGGRITIEPRLATFEELQPAESTSETSAEATADGQNDERQSFCLAYSSEQRRWLGEYGLIRVRETIVALRKALIDESRAIASEACEALGKKKKLAADAIPEIVQRFWQLGSIGIEALGRIGTDEAKAEIYAIYKRHENGMQEDDQWIREETRPWLERWLILSPAEVIGTPNEIANKNQDASDGSQSN